MVSSPLSVIENQYGAERLPPHNLEAEQSLLGSLLLDRDAIIKVAAFVKPDDFYLPANGTVYRAILDLYNRREPTDFVTLSDELGRREQLDQVGGIAYLSALLNAVPTAVHVEYYGRIVERGATLRRLIDAGSAIVGIGFRDGIETEEALDAAERAIFEVSQKRQTKDFVSIAEVLNRFFDQIDYMQQHRGDVVGVPTGFADLDQLTGGLQKSDLVILAARPSMGKALSLDTPLPTPAGWTTMGQVAVGDELIDEQGNPCRITFVSEVMANRPCYAVQFSDGAVIVADAEHQWLTSTRAARRSAHAARLPKRRDSPYSIDQQHRRTFPAIVTTEEIRATLTAGSDDRWNHIVSAAEPLRLPETILPVPPYTMGAWLGDGSSAGAMIYSADAAVLQGIREEGVHVGEPKPCNGGLALAYRLGGGTQRGGDHRASTSLQTTLRRHHMLANKHIPAAYLRAGLDQRRDLLAGLMDTDGYVDPTTGVCEFVTINARLARDVAELVATLGWIPSLKQGRASINGKDCGVKWRVRFSPDACVFRLARKAATQITKARPKINQRCIVAVEPVPSVPVRCVQVDSPSRLYLAGERMIPTHNTSLALGIAYGAAIQHQKTVGVFSLEMSAEQLVQRLLAMETGVDSHRLRLGQIDDGEWDRISRAFGRLAEASIFIDDGSGSSVMDVRSKARRLQAEHGLDMVIVDYLQLMSSRRSENRVQEISEISRGLKGLARELNVPVVALSQLSRAVESRSDHRPMLSDLRESGAIEQDADIVMFIYREDKYEEDSEKKGIAEIIVAKHRNGPVGTISLRFFERTARFADLELYREPGA
ncbi:MAG: replicative DNA helicase [Chloroflexota bacterium]|nr:replicative DNA helicase [Chloroflexota bacterium]